MSSQATLDVIAVHRLAGHLLSMQGGHRFDVRETAEADFSAVSVRAEPFSCDPTRTIARLRLQVRRQTSAGIRVAAPDGAVGINDRLIRGNPTRLLKRYCEDDYDNLSLRCS